MNVIENAPWVGNDRTDVLVSQEYFSPEDFFGYAGVFAEYDSALRAGGLRASVLNYTL